MVFSTRSETGAGEMGAAKTEATKGKARSMLVNRIVVGVVWLVGCLDERLVVKDVIEWSGWMRDENERVDLVYILFLVERSRRCKRTVYCLPVIPECQYAIDEK